MYPRPKSTGFYCSLKLPLFDKSKLIYLCHRKVTNYDEIDIFAFARKNTEL